MTEDSLASLLTTLLVLAVFVFIGWSVKAASTGQIKRNSFIGLRTHQMMHCDDCWLLGHHAAATKTRIGLVLGGLLMGAVGLASFFLDVSPSLLGISQVAGMLVMVAGLLMGLRDGHTMVAKMHAVEQGTK